MKINPITSTAQNYAIKQKSQDKVCVVSNPKELLANKSSAYYGRDLLAFKAQSPLAEKLIKTSRIEKALAGSLAKIETGDFLAIGKSINSIKNAVKNFIPNYTLPIKSIGMCEIPDIKETAVILKGPTPLCHIWNLSDEIIRINGLWGLENNGSMWIEEGDRIGLGNTWIELKTNDSEAASTLNNDSFEYFNFEDLLKVTAKQHNAKLLAQIFNPKNSPKTKNNLSFDKIGGQDEVIKALKRNILFPLKFPEAFDGFMMNRGAVLYGPPGTGKTLIAKTLGVESNASVFEMCATDMQDKYVGGSEKNCRDLFQKAVDAQPSIIYLDEFEALGKTRGGQDVHGDKLLNQFLSLMSELEKNNDRVYVIASTNRIQDIDPAILRSGRFALKLEVKQPDLAGTKQILDIHSKGKPIDENLDYDAIAQKMFAKKMSGADIAVTVKEAASNAFERSGIYKSMEEGRYTPEMLHYFRITMDDFNKAIDAFTSETKKRNPVGFIK